MFLKILSKKHFGNLMTGRRYVNAKYYKSCYTLQVFIIGSLKA